MLKLAGRTAFRLAAALAVVSSMLLIWISLGVGLIGADGDPANRIYFAVIAVGIVGALVARFRAGGLALTLFAMAVLQLLVGLYAIAAGLGMPYSPPLEILGLTAFFVFSFAVSGWLFRKAS